MAVSVSANFYPFLDHPRGLIRKLLMFIGPLGNSLNGTNQLPPLFGRRYLDFQPGRGFECPPSTASGRAPYGLCWTRNGKLHRIALTIKLNEWAERTLRWKIVTKHLFSVKHFLYVFLSYYLTRSFKLYHAHSSAVEGGHNILLSYFFWFIEFRRV